MSEFVGGESARFSFRLRGYCTCGGSDVKVWSGGCGFVQRKGKLGCDMDWEGWWFDGVHCELGNHVTQRSRMGTADPSYIRLIARAGQGFAGRAGGLEFVEAEVAIRNPM